MNNIPYYYSKYDFHKDIQHVNRDPHSNSPKPIQNAMENPS